MEPACGAGGGLRPRLTCRQLGYTAGAKLRRRKHWHYVHCAPVHALTLHSLLRRCIHWHSIQQRACECGVARVPAPPVLCAACVVVSGCHCGGACICVDCTPTMTITLTPPAHAPRPPAQHPARARTRAQIFRAPAVPPPVCHNGLILVATDPERPLTRAQDGPGSVERLI